jgi:hypothetical protein
MQIHLLLRICFRVIFQCIFNFFDSSVTIELIGNKGAEDQQHDEESGAVCSVMHHFFDLLLQWNNNPNYDFVMHPLLMTIKDSNTLYIFVFFYLIDDKVYLEKASFFVFLRTFDLKQNKILKPYVRS